ncbi:SRPBCC family protein [Arthrobacter sp. 260]|uniref:SRPBCC family protein n=1 Tax=Arthrobacter sp. 260 TaxID=2735314 RepID=UPI0014928DAC|nr:SRPBCC family protein [Arthrobacter sp. 260]NOJ61584.1 hypothetical protein [Arthrobacter sp. 260]
MSQAFASHETINLPAETVWTQLTDWSGAPRWMPGVSDPKTDGDLAVGSPLRFTARGKERVSEVTQLAPGRSITLTSHVGRTRADYQYSLTPLDAGSTAVDLVATVTTDGAMKLLGPVIRKAIAREDSVQLTNFRKTLEGPPVDAD